MWINKAHKRIHARVGGLVKVMRQWRKEKSLDGGELGRLNYLIRRIEEILAEDDVGMPAANSTANEEWAETIPDPYCEFYKIDDHKITCALGYDMYQCSKQCRYSTSNPRGIPPYMTKYMNGRL